MKLSVRLYNETKTSHTNIDTHQFISIIRTNTLAQTLYINFNKVCIFQIQKTLKLKNTLLQSKLHKHFYVPDMFISKSFQKLLQKCTDHTLEHEYMFKIGLMMGGSLLKRYIKHEDSFLTFDNPNILVKDFKTYLDTNVTDQDSFIKIVNESYELIKNIFDEFLTKL